MIPDPIYYVITTRNTAISTHRRGGYRIFRKGEGGCLLFLNSKTGKIIAEKSNYREGLQPP